MSNEFQTNTYLKTNKEFEDGLEHLIDEEITVYQETSFDEEYNTSGATKSKKRSSNGFSSTVAILSVGTGVIVGAGILLTSSSNIDVSMDYQAYGNHISYNIDIKMDYVIEEGEEIDFANKDTGLDIQIVGGAREYTVDLKADNALEKGDLKVYDVNQTTYHLEYYFGGEIDGLLLNTKYFIDIRYLDSNGKETVYYTSSFTTKLEPVSEVTNIKWFGDEFGSLYAFRLIYSDELDYFSEFMYTITPKSNPDNFIYSEQPIEVPSDKQVIPDATLLPKDTYVLTVAYFSSDPSETNGDIHVFKTLHIDVVI